MSSNDLWTQSLLAIKEQFRTLPASPGCVYGVFSPEPIYQKLDLPSPKDFKEVYKLHSDSVQGRRIAREFLLKYSHQSMVALYPLSSENKQAECEYHENVAKLLKIIFGGKNEAKQILGIQDNIDLNEQDIWSIILFRLATMQIDGSPLRPQGTSEKDDVFKTLWPKCIEDQNSCDFVKISDNKSFAFPKNYYGSVWILEEVSGSLQQLDSETIYDSCVIRFTPPLVLYGATCTDESVNTEFPPYFYYAWTGQPSSFSTVTIQQADGTFLEEFDQRRILGIHPLFSWKAQRAGDCSNNLYRNEEYQGNRLIFKGQAKITQINRPSLCASTSTEIHEIPIRILFLNHEDGVELLIWPYEEPKKLSKKDHNLITSLSLEKDFVGGVWVLEEIQGSLDADDESCTNTGTVKFTQPLLLGVETLGDTESAYYNETPDFMEEELYCYYKPFMPSVSCVEREEFPLEDLDSKCIEIYEGKKKVSLKTTKTCWTVIGTTQLSHVYRSSKEQGYSIQEHVFKVMARMSFRGDDCQLELKWFGKSTENTNSSLKFTQSNLPLFHFGTQNDIHAIPIRIEDAEEILNFHKTSNNDNSRPEIVDSSDLLPQQRITNVIQILDNLVGSSVEAIDIVLSQGREEIKATLERTAPVFNTAFGEGVFSANLCRNLLFSLQNGQANDKASLEQNFVDTQLSPEGQDRFPFQKQRKKRRPPYPFTPRLVEYALEYANANDDEEDILHKMEKIDPEAIKKAIKRLNKDWDSIKKEFNYRKENPYSLEKGIVTNAKKMPSSRYFIDIRKILRKREKKTIRMMFEKTKGRVSFGLSLLHFLP